MVDYDLDKFIRHQLYLERLGTGGARQVTKDLRKVYLAIRLVLLEEGEITTQRQLNKIVNAINKIIARDKTWDLLTESNIKDLVLYEAQWQENYQSQSLGAKLGSVTAKEIAGLITNSPINVSSGTRVDVGVWGDFIQAQKNNHAQTVTNIVKRGYIRNQTLPQIIKDIKNVSEGAIARNAESLARTAHNHFSSQANDLVINKNKRLLDEYFYMVTFDSRTSDICIGITKFNRKGRRFKVGDPKAPLPPLHFQCRTRRMAVPAGYTFEDDETYEQWLKRQPRDFINETLGKKRASLLIDDKIPLTKFSDMSGRPLTIEQIKGLDN